MNLSFFEIGGHIVECHSTSIPSPLPSASLFRGAPTQSRSAGASAAESTNVGGRKADHMVSMDRSTPETGVLGQPIVPYPFGIFHLEKFLPE